MEVLSMCKPKIDYAIQFQQMGDLLNCFNVSFSNWRNQEKNKLKKQLEQYMGCFSQSAITIDLKTVRIVIQGSDEASYLYQYL